MHVRDCSGFRLFPINNDQIVIKEEYRSNNIEGLAVTNNRGIFLIGYVMLI